MAALWHARVSRRLAPILGLAPVAVLLTGCLGWFPQFSSTDGAQLSGISCPSSTMCVAVGETSSQDAVVEQTTDAGGQWTADTNGVSGLALNAVSCADDEHCVAVGGVSTGGIMSPSNSVLVTTDGGTSWQASSDPSVDGYLSSVSCADVDHCWATSSSGIVGVGAIIDTTDGASSWTTTSWSPPAVNDGAQLSSAWLNAITCPTTDECLAVGQANYMVPSPPGQVEQGMVVTTGDGGQTWQTQFVSAMWLTGISCPSAQSCVAVGSASSYQLTTPDDGGTWTVTALTSGDQMADGNAPAVNAISCPNLDQCIAVGQFVPRSGATYETPIVATADGGRTWSNQSTSANTEAVDLEGVTCVTTRSCWAVGFANNGSLVLHTITGGAGSPTVSGLSPSVGPASGGQMVTVVGSGFDTGVTSVQFGSQTAAEVQVVSDSELTAMAPALPGGPASGTTAVDVTVTTAIGTSALAAADQFVYNGTASSPSLVLSTTAPGATCDDTGPPLCSGLGAGATVTVTGAGFRPGSLVSVAECSSEQSQPVVPFLGLSFPVSCSPLAIAAVPSVGPTSGEVHDTLTVHTGALGPPVNTVTPTCTAAGAAIPNCTTSGDATTDAASYPCPPTPAQDAAGDTCQVAITDMQGGPAITGTLLYGTES